MLIGDFLFDRRPMPQLGDTYYLFKGKSHKPMSPNNHNRIIREVFEELQMDPSKVTHEFRVFAAIAMHEMGVSLEVSWCLLVTASVQVHVLLNMHGFLCLVLLIQVMCA